MQIDRVDMANASQDRKYRDRGQGMWTEPSYLIMMSLSCWSFFLGGNRMLSSITADFLATTEAVHCAAFVVEGACRSVDSGVVVVRARISGKH